MLAPRIAARPPLNASRKLGICWSVAALLATSVGAETRVYGAFASNYVFRGVSWSQDRGSASVGFDWQHPSGAYAGANLASVREGAETDLYAGYTRQYGIFALDFGATAYDYSDHRYVDGTFRELYVGGQAGPVGVSVYRGRYADLQYWYGAVDAGVPAGPVTIEMHYGLSDYEFGERMSDQYFGVASNWRGLDWRLRFTHREGEGDSKFVAAISKSWTVSR
jgi:uncharacterized protein (TIGR02001 family)